MAVLQSQSNVMEESTALEIVLTILPTVFFACMSNLLASVIGKTVTADKYRHFIFDFILIVIPSILTFTICSQYVKEISYVVGFFTLILLILDKLSLLKDTFSWTDEKKQKSKSTSQVFNTYFITNARSTINILTAIAILAVDFKIFPRHFAKTTTFGYSLMDSGVGLYILSNGIVAPETKLKKYPIMSSIKGSIILLLLGIGRFILTKQVNYNIQEIEYGVHWNFFLTLAFTKIFSSLILNFFKIQYIVINSLLLIFAHEILLQAGLQNFVIYAKRGEHLISANKEGIVSLLGYIFLYLFSVYFGYLLNKNKNKSNFKIVSIIYGTSAISLILSLTFKEFFDISRRVANAAYCFWVIFIGTFMLGLYYIMQKIQESRFRRKQSFYVFSPFILESANFNGLVFFIAANVLTGLVNLCINTWSQSDFVSFIILVCYMFINCLVVSVLFCKKLKLKL